MTNLSNIDKWHLSWKLSNVNGEILAEEILKIHGKNIAPTNKVSSDDYLQILSNINHSISSDFGDYDKDARFTGQFLESGLSVADIEIYKNNLILTTAIIFTGNIFYTD